MKTIAKMLVLLVTLGFTSVLYTCSDDDDAPPVESTEANILTFTLTEQTGAATINASTATVEIEVENGTNLTNLTPNYTVSDGATVIGPASGIAGDFSVARTIEVTAEDGVTEKIWTVTVTEAGGGGGSTTVEFGDGGTTKATAIRNLVVDGVTYDVEFISGNPTDLYGAYEGTFTFTTNAETVTAIDAINAALNGTAAFEVGETGGTLDEGRYRIGYESFQTTVGGGTQDNCRFNTGIFEPASWREGAEETAVFNEPNDLIFAKFIAQ